MDDISKISKDFWLHKIANKQNYIIIKGHCYYIDEKYYASKETKGTEYTIKFFDGKKITTTDLWHCGKIPKEYLDESCNNAEFIK